MVGTQHRGGKAGSQAIVARLTGGGKNQRTPGEERKQDGVEGKGSTYWAHCNWDAPIRGTGVSILSAEENAKENVESQCLGSGTSPSKGGSKKYGEGNKIPHRKCQRSKTYKGGPETGKPGFNNDNKWEVKSFGKRVWGGERKKPGFVGTERPKDCGGKTRLGLASPPSF